MTSGRLGVAGGEIAYDVAGDGPALVVVHAGICDRRMWGPLVPLLHGRQVVALDMRGFGASSPVTDGADRRRDLVALLDHLGIERAALCGVSFGGVVALETALVVPDRVSALVVCGSALDWSTLPAELEARIVEADAAGEQGDVDRAVELELGIWVDGVGRPEPVDPGIRERVGTMNRRAWELALAATGEPAGLDPPAGLRLGELAVPTLVVAGAFDVPWMVESARRLAGSITGARFELLDGCAHLPPLERPEAFAALLASFV